MHSSSFTSKVSQVLHKSTQPQSVSEPHGSVGQSNSFHICRLPLGTWVVYSIKMRIPTLHKYIYIFYAYADTFTHLCVYISICHVPILHVLLLQRHTCMHFFAHTQTKIRCMTWFLYIRIYTQKISLHIYIQLFVCVINFIHVILLIYSSICTSAHIFLLIYF